MNKDVIKLAIALTIVTGIAAATLSFVYDSTKDAIAESKRQEKLKAIKAVLPGYDNEPDKDIIELVSGKDKKGNDVKRVFYRGKKGEEITGIAFTSSNMLGYSGFIDVMVGIDPNGTVSAIEVISHAETPGLGDKIAFSPWKDQYKGKNLTNTKWLVTKDGGDFTILTGATISPRAVTKAVKDGLDFYAAHKDEILK
ncbi:MAG: RnfABCDGE type electron transport complex subunit G [Deltaproteobacteria bacterium]|nr:RnfABCDGE type electron transport complex subunit G [Deltaproteobacteria bacterium]